MLKNFTSFFKIRFSRYDNELINSLQDEHKILLEEFLKIEHMLKNSYKKTSIFLLKSFKEKLLKHLKKEDDKLYPYLKKKLSKEKIEFVIDKEREMVDIVKVLEQNLFIEDYQEILKNIETIKSHLVARIEEEENTLFQEYLNIKK